jgi:hypothetical protein
MRVSFAVTQISPLLYLDVSVFAKQKAGDDLTSKSIEDLMDIQVTPDRWMLSPGYAFEEIHMRLLPASRDTGSRSDAEGSRPEHSAQCRSQIAFPHHFSWNTAGYLSGGCLEASEPCYTRLETNLFWQFGERSPFRIIGQNLRKDHHAEFVEPTAAREQPSSSAVCLLNSRFRSDC